MAEALANFEGQRAALDEEMGALNQKIEALRSARGDLQAVINQTQGDLDTAAKMLVVILPVISHTVAKIQGDPEECGSE